MMTGHPAGEQRASKVKSPKWFCPQALARPMAARVAGASSASRRREAGSPRTTAVLHVGSSTSREKDGAQLNLRPRAAPATRGRARLRGGGPAVPRRGTPRACRPAEVRAGSLGPSGLCLHLRPGRRQRRHTGRPFPSPCAPHLRPTPERDDSWVRRDASSFGALRCPALSSLNFSNLYLGLFFFLSFFLSEKMSEFLPPHFPSPSWRIHPVSRGRGECSGSRPLGPTVPELRITVTSRTSRASGKRAVSPPRRAPLPAPGRRAKVVPGGAPPGARCPLPHRDPCAWFPAPPPPAAHARQAQGRAPGLLSRVPLTSSSGH